MLIVVAGPRDLVPTFEEVAEALEESGFNPTAIVSGKSTGVDTVAIEYAKHYGIQPIEMEALWNFYRKQGNVKVAGPKRNGMMALVGEALVVIRRKGEHTSGTSNMIEKAKEYGLPTYIKEYDG